MAEKDETHDEKDRQRFADRVLSIAEDAVYWAIAVILVAGAVALLVAQVKTMFSLLDTPTSKVMLELLDGVLLIFIFVELLYAVRTSLRSHEIAVEPFLIVGILACIKEIWCSRWKRPSSWVRGRSSPAIVQTGCRRTGHWTAVARGC